MRSISYTFNKIILGLFALLVFTFLPSVALAHVVVKPSEVGVGVFQTFTIGVPSEKDIPTINLRLVIPEGIKHVTPNVKPGWKIDLKKEGEGEDAKITEINWSGGSVPAEQRDEFLFSAQVPGEETSLTWKAYQTYQDGSIVSWDQDPKLVSEGTDEESEKAGPFSETKVINDLKISQNQETEIKTDSNNLPTLLSFLAIIMSGAALFLQVRKK